MVIESQDLGPVGSGPIRSIDVHRSDGSLQLVWPRLVLIQAGSNQRLALLHRSSVPQAPVLVGQTHQGPVVQRSKPLALKGEPIIISGDPSSRPPNWAMAACMVSVWLTLCMASGLEKTAK